MSLHERMYVIFILWLHTIAESKRFSGELSPSIYKSVNQRVKKAPDEYSGAVDFGHVYRNAFNDGSLNRQTDDDDVVEQNNANEKFHYPYNRQWTPKPDSLTFLSPRDEIQFYNKHNLEASEIKGTGLNGTEQKRLSRPTWYDFPKLLERNLANPLASRRSKVAHPKGNRKYNKIDNSRVNASNLFEESAFYLKPNRNSRNMNWTTCDEFAKRADFHPDDVVNTQWLPFYIWSRRGFTSSTIYTFSYPTKKIVQYYKTNYKPYIIKNLNWYEPKLLMKERREILLIAADRRGLFYGIPKQELPSNVNGINITLPILTLRMKIRDPYLALMYCDEHYALIMAELGTGPDNDHDKTLEANTLKFKGTGNPVNRDIEAERFELDLKKKRMLETEARKIIHIENPLGDVDFNVRHS